MSTWNGFMQKTGPHAWICRPSCSILCYMGYFVELNMLSYSFRLAWVHFRFDSVEGSKLGFGLVFMGLVLGLVGTLLDSLLGGTLQYTGHSRTINRVRTIQQFSAKRSVYDCNQSDGIILAVGNQPIPIADLKQEYNQNLILACRRCLLSAFFIIDCISFTIAHEGLHERCLWIGLGNSQVEIRKILQFLTSEVLLPREAIWIGEKYYAWMTGCSCPELWCHYVVFITCETNIWLQVVNKPGPDVTLITGRDILNNDAVNFVSSILTASVAGWWAYSKH